MSQFRLSRKHKSRDAAFHFTGTTRNHISVVEKEVHLGNHKPTDHFAPAAGTFIANEDLYENRKRGRA